MEERVCVVGAAGYVGSHLVKTLLHRGFTVNATLRNPDDPQKIRPLLSLEGASERLKLFKADLNQENSLDSAIQGCTGVFHVASPLANALAGLSDEQVIEAAEKGVSNVLRSCSRAKTVKRVVYTSSTAASAPVNENGENIGPVDESKWTPLNFAKNHIQLRPWQLYSIYKTVAEQTAFRYGEEIGIQVVSIGPTLISGPSITEEFPFSSLCVLSPLTGKEDFFEVLRLQRKYSGAVSIVHIDDVCDAHVFLMEHPSATGRHICSAVFTSISEYFGFLHSRYPHLVLKIEAKTEEDDYPFAEASSKKLREMGFAFRHGLADILDDCISAAQLHGLLP